MDRIEELENLLKSLEMQSEDLVDEIRGLKIRQMKIFKHMNHIEKQMQILKLK